MKDMFQDALRGAKVLLPVIGGFAVCGLLFGPAGLLVPLITVLLFLVCALIGISVK